MDRKILKRISSKVRGAGILYSPVSGSLLLRTLEYPYWSDRRLSLLLRTTEYICWVGFEAFTSVTMKRSIFCGVRSYSPVEVNWQFAGAHRHLLKGRRASQNKKLTWIRQQPLKKWRYVPPIRRLKFTGLHGVVSQKRELFITFIVPNHSMPMSF